MVKVVSLILASLSIASSVSAQVICVEGRENIGPHKHLFLTASAGGGAVIDGPSKRHYQRVFTPSWFVNVGVGVDMPGTLRAVAFYGLVGFESRAHYERVISTDFTDVLPVYDKGYRANFITLNALLSYRGFFSLGPSILIPVSEQRISYASDDNWYTNSLSLSGLQFGVTGILNIPVWIGKNYDRGVGLGIYYNYPILVEVSNSRYRMPFLGIGVTYGGDLNSRFRTSGTGQ